MKSLIVPVVTPSWLPSESDLLAAQNNGGVFTLYGAEWSTHTEMLIDWAPQSFHDNCTRLLQSFAGRVSGILVWGTTGEGPWFDPLQYGTLLTVMKHTCPKSIHLYAGVLGSDGQVWNQVQVAQELWYDIVLGLNNYGCNNTDRFKSAMEKLSPAGRLLLYNLPTFKPANKEFVLGCLNDSRVVGFKDSSGDAEFFSWLLSLKAEKLDLQIFHGSEAGYWKLSSEELDFVDGLVAGTANVDSQLLREFTDDPHDTEIFDKLEILKSDVAFLSKRALSDTLPATKIAKNIHGLKILLNRKGILDNSSMYCHPSSTLFQTYQNR